jgi:transcription antitermination factor NusG
LQLFANTEQKKVKWYALYTNPRAEKKVEQELLKRSYQVFLPQRITIKQWSDRKKKVTVPLFPSYIFICIDDIERNYFDILNTPGVVKFIRMGKDIVSIRAKQIQEIRLFLSNFENYEVLSEHFEPKMPVEVVAGPLKGTKGIVSEHKGNKLFIIEIEQIGFSLALSLPANYLKKLK